MTEILTIEAGWLARGEVRRILNRAGLTWSENWGLFKSSFSVNIAITAVPLIRAYLADSGARIVR